MILTPPPSWWHVQGLEKKVDIALTLCLKLNVFYPHPSFTQDACFLDSEPPPGGMSKAQRETMLAMSHILCLKVPCVLDGLAASFLDTCPTLMHTHMMHVFWIGLLHSIVGARLRHNGLRLRPAEP